MDRKYFVGLIIASVVAIFLIFISLWQGKKEDTYQKDHFAHSKSPYASNIFGLGIVEPSSDNIYIGSPVNRIVESIPVHVGEHVNKGAILVEFENKDLQSELTVQKLALDTEVARLNKLEAMPRTEDLMQAEAQFKSAEANMALAKKEYESVLGLENTHALSQEQINRRVSTYKEAEANWARAKADYEKVKAGAWKPDLDIAKLAVEQAKASVARIQTEIDRTIIRAPIDSVVLQIRVHQGEVPSMELRAPIMVIGNTDEMHVRVSINQFDVPYFSETAPAEAFLQGDSRKGFPLEFVKVEPYFVNKQSITNAISETIDTRVLQVIYKFKDNSQKVYVGQQMDVFIEAEYPKHD